MAAPRSSSSVLVLLVACAAWLSACRPSVFDGLTGGAHDAALDADAGAALADAESAADDPPFEDASELPDAEADLDTSAIDLLDTAVPADAEGDAAVASLELTVGIASDADDGLWCMSEGVLEESLHFNDIDGEPGYSLEVGADSEDCRAGLIFELPFGRGARVEAAALRLYRVSRELGPHTGALADATMRVYVFDDADVPALDALHLHDEPGQHSARGLWFDKSVGGYAVGAQNAETVSPDLSVLVNHVLAQASEAGPARIGFALMPDQMNGRWVQFADTAAGGHAPLLELRYTLAP